MIHQYIRDNEGRGKKRGRGNDASDNSLLNSVPECSTIDDNTFASNTTQL